MFMQKNINQVTDMNLPNYLLINNICYTNLPNYLLINNIC